MKTTIYELLGMIKDGNAPKKIKHNKLIFEYVDGGYYNSNYGFLFDNYYVEGILNDEVEILDEPKENKIEKLKPIEELITSGELQTAILETQLKVNELIDEVNKLKESDK
jgi:hypothetical protein